MDAQMIEKTRKIKYNLQYAKSQLAMAENILKNDFTVNGINIEKKNIDNLLNSLSNLIYLLNYNILPSMSYQLDNESNDN